MCLQALPLLSTCLLFPTSGRSHRWRRRRLGRRLRILFLLAVRVEDSGFLFLPCCRWECTYSVFARFSSLFLKWKWRT